MADVVNTEAISKAVVRESLGTPALGSAEAVAAEMIERTDKGNWREALQFGAETTVSRSDVLGRVDQIGAERDAAGKRTRATGSPEELRFNAASKAAELALKYEQKGYDGLDGTEKTSVREKVKNTILQNPSIAKEFNALNTTEKRAFLERMLSDNSYAVEVRKALGEFSEAKGVDDSASEKQVILEQKTTEQAIKLSELDDTQRRLGAIETRLKTFDGTTTPPGTQAQEMERIRGTLPTLQAEAANFQQQMEDKNFRLAQLQQERQAVLTVIPRGGTYAGRPMADIDNEILTVRGELQTATSNFNSRAAELNKLPLLEQEQASLEAKRLDLAREEAEKKIAKGQADINLAKAQRELQDALALRQRQEEDIVSSLDGVFSAAAKDLIDKQIEAYGSNFEEALKTVDTESLTTDEKTIITSLESRWVKTINARRFGGRTTPRRVIDQAKVNNEFGQLMSQGDEAYLKTMIMNTIKDPATGATYSDTDAIALLANEAFMEKTRPKVLSQLVARKAVIGGIEDSDIYTITQSRWGKDVISQAISANDNFKNQVEALLGKGALDQPDFMEKLRREAQNRPTLMSALAAALVAAGGGIVGAGVVGAAAAGAAVGGGVFAGSSYARGSKMFG